MGASAISASFGLDLAPLKQGFAQAEAIAKTGVAKVAAVMDQGLAKAEQNARKVAINWGNVQANTLRAPQRTFRTGADFRPARPGQYPSPIEQEALPAAGGGGRGGRGGFFPAGIRGIGVAAAVYQLAAAYKSATEAAGKLVLANAAVFKPVGGGTALAVGDLEQKLADIKEINQEISQRERIEKHKRDNPNAFLSLLESASKGTRQFVNKTLGAGSFEEQDAAEAAEKGRRQKEVVNTLGLMADKQKEINAIEFEGIHGSEEKAALQKAELQNRENLLKIAKTEAELGITGHSKLADEEKQRYEHQVQAIAKAISLKQDELTLEENIASIERGLLTNDEKRLAVTKERIAALESRLAVEGDPIKQREIGLELGRAKNDAFEERFRQRNEPEPGGAIWQTPEMREISEKAHFARNESRFGQRSRHLDASGNEIDPATRSTLEQRSARVPGAYNGPMDKDWHKEGMPGLSTMSKDQPGGKAGDSGGKDVGAALSGIEKNTAEMVRLWNN